MTYYRDWWKTLKSFPIWQRISFVVFNVLGISVSTVWTGLDYFKSIPLWNHYLMWGSVLLLTGSGVFLVGQRSWERAQAEIAALRTDDKPRLEMLGGQGGAFEHVLRFSGQQQQSRTFRVALTNTSQTITARGIHVRCARLVPAGATMPLPLRLSVMRDDTDPFSKHPEPVIWEFPLNPRETRFVDVCSVIDGKPGLGVATSGWRELRGHYVQAIQYEVSVVAYGNDIPPCAGHFRIDIPATGPATMTRISVPSDS